MAIKFCIFCGNEPENKCKEHVLPQWLIRMTGDPGRVVSFGCSLLSGKEYKYSWSSFTFPSCKACNERYSELEAINQEIITSLVERTPVRCGKFLQLLDWFDKVRIGLWLGYSYLQENPLGIKPNFYIDSRLGIKDRMLAIYTFDSKLKGLNAHGAETLCFQMQPSCLSLRINNTIFLNMSWDYMCSRQCGFPYPRKTFIDLDNDGMLDISDFIFSHRVAHPILERKLIKPTIHIYQPIMNSIKTRDDYPEDEWLKNRILEGTINQGFLHRQWDKRIEVIEDERDVVDFDEVTGEDCERQSNIVAQTYDFQLYSSNIFEYRSKNEAKLERKAVWKNAYEEQNKKIIEYLANC